MSSLQEFARLQLQAPGDLQPQQMASAPPMDPQASPPVDQIPVSQGGAPVSQEPLPSSPLPMGPIDPAVTNAVAQTQAAPAPNLHSISGLEHNAENAAHQAEVDGLRSYADLSKAAKDKAQITQKEYDAQAPIIDRQLQLQNDAAKKLETQQQQLHDFGTKAMGDYQQTVNALSDKIANQPHDIFGRAGVNKASGIIGLILGGLGGSANGGKNAGVERLNQLTEQNVNQQKFEYDMLRGKSDMQNNQYAMLRQQGHDDLTATNTVLAAKMQGTITQLEKSKASFAPMKANNEADQVIGQLKVNLDNLKSETQRHVYGQAIQAQKLRLQQEQMRNESAQFYAKLGAEKTEAKRLADVNPIANFVDLPPNYAKDNNQAVEALRIKTDTFLSMDKIAEEYKETSVTDFDKRAALRLAWAREAAMFDGGSSSVRKGVLDDAESESGGNTVFGVQSGRTAFDIDGRLAEGQARRAQQMKDVVHGANGKLKGILAETINRSLGGGGKPQTADIKRTASQILEKYKDQSKFRVLEEDDN